MEKLEKITGIAFLTFLSFSTIGMLVFAPIWAGVIEVLLLIVVFVSFFIATTHDSDEIPTDSKDD